ncbi:LysR family transcriptional regulator [Caulobacter sp. RL271]|jgi:DNA-binding transcriptional LysR family regulator|uniref:LysR substrate-binding domain-containing protein n=1 Tax=Caulobacter segnis TaxID=88688 RepID=A0ABY5A284_9CAUL|nr:LysR family transcriptional regulator [Caulobacter segnis]USQ98241.1 LysR substrate-binding domain-containing protein [Caulobacter segnis]
MHITLGQIRAFVTVASTNSFTRAAEVLALSQPALTNRVRQFEEALGLRLFDRNTRSVELTHVGRELLPIFLRTITEFEGAVVNARDFVSKTKGLVRLACLPSCAATMLPELIARFQLDHPNVTFEVEDALNSAIATLVREDRVDFGIGMADANDDDLEQIKLFDDAMMLVHPEGHPVADAPTISVETLATYPLILMNRGSSVRDLVDGAFIAAGRTATPACQVRYMSTAVALVRAGLGLAILPSTAVEFRSQANVRARRIQDPAFTRTIVLMRRRHSPVRPVVQTFIDSICVAAGSVSCGFIE